MAFCRLPETGLGLRAPPRRMRTLITTTPGLALYPRFRAVTSFVGRTIRFMTGSRLHVIAECLIQSFVSEDGFCQVSFMWE